MKLKNAARWADRTRLLDAYNPGAVQLYAQVSSYIDNQQDGAISKRRVISYAPDQVLPARRVVTYEGEVWIVGDTMVDMWKGKPIRRSAATKKASGLYWIRSPGQAALAAGGIQAYGQLDYLKDTINVLTNSAYSPQYEVHFSSVESLRAGQVLVMGSTYLHVRSCYPVLDGFVTATSDDLGDAARQAVAVKTRGAYDSTSDSYPVTTVNTYGIVLDYYKLYDRDTALSYGQSPGDLTLLVASSVVNPKVGDTLTLYSAEWRVLGENLDADSHMLHIRRVG